jgi:monoterpene epsilon-lactone hydrolase
MARRPEVQVASLPITAIDIAGLAGAFVAALSRTAFRAPWRGPASIPRNVAVASTRELVRSLMGYMTALPIDEFRALERVLDDISRVALPPFVRAEGIAMRSGSVAGVPGLWFRRDDAEPVATIVYLHGGGYIGTSPSMYAVFMAHLSRVSRCDVFAADYRLAPEFPFPAGTQDAVGILAELSERGRGPVVLAGDSGGGGLVGSVLGSCAGRAVPTPIAVVLFSPEVDLVLDEPSVRENAALDILPWNIPTSSYLGGVSPNDPGVSLLTQELTCWPATFISYGSDEIFRDSIRLFVARLDEAGVRHEAHEVPDMFHVFPFLLPWAQESRRVYHEVGRFIESLVTAE